MTCCDAGCFHSISSEVASKFRKKGPCIRAFSFSFISSFVVCIGFLFMCLSVSIALFLPTKCFFLKIHGLYIAITTIRAGTLHIETLGLLPNSAFPFQIHSVRSTPISIQCFSPLRIGEMELIPTIHPKHQFRPASNTLPEKKEYFFYMINVCHPVIQSCLILA